MKKKISLLIISIFALFIGVNKVDAARLSYASDLKKNGNTTEIGVFLYVESGETINEVKFVCSTDNAEVKCEIKKNTNYDGPAFVFEGGIAKTSPNENFKVGENEVVKLVLTNNSNKDVSVKVSLDGSTYLPNESQKLYSISVDGKQSSNPKASDIHFSQGTMVPAFNPDITEYTVYNIQDTINSINAFYTCQEECSDKGWSGGKAVNGSKITLNQGENKVSIELESADGQNKQTYNFTIIRGSTQFNSSKLGSLEVGDYILTPAFSKDVTEYSVNIPNKITSLENVLKFAAEDSNANVAADKYDNLVVGENIIKITVDSVNSDSTTTYTLKVNRMTLESIEVTNFKNGVVSYLDGEGVKQELPEKEFKMQYPDDYIKIIDGTYKFNDDGERISEKNDQQDNKDDKEEPKKKKDNKVFLIVGLVVVGLIIIGVSGFLIFKKKPTDKDKKKKNKSKTDEELSENDSDEESNKENKEDQEDEEIDETGIEESAIRLTKVKPHNEDDTVDIDEALSDLMSTKQYNLDELTKKEED